MPLGKSMPHRDSIMPGRLYGKTQLSLSLMVLCVCCTACAQSSGPIQRTPMRYEAREPSPYVTAPFRACRYLVASQSPDGSWTNSSSRVQSTALCLSALLRMGNTRLSDTYGPAVTKAYAWLKEAPIRSGPDRVAAIIALSDFYNMHREPETTDRVRALLDSFDTKTSGPWTDLFSYTRLPDQDLMPQAVPKPHDTDQKYRALENHLNLKTVADYLAMYLTSHAKYRSGGRLWIDHNRTFTPQLVESQMKGGAFPAEEPADQPAVTALVIFSFAQLHAGASQFDPPWDRVPRPIDDDNDEAIEIDIRVGPDGSLTTHRVTPTNSVLVTARVTAHHKSGAGCMEPGGGFYLYLTDFVIRTPTNFADVVLTMQTIGQDAALYQSNAVATVRIPTASLQAAKAGRKPCRIERSQIIDNTSSPP